MDVETPLPGLAEENVEPIDDIQVTDGDLEMELGPDGQPVAPQEVSEEQANFMRALTDILSQLSEECQGEVAQAMQGQAMDKLTDKCKVEFSQAAAKVPEYAKMQEAAIKQQADMARRTNGRQPDPNTGLYLGTALLVLFAGICYYIYYVNSKLKEAGLLDRKAKPLSKKKLEKLRTKDQKKIKI